MGMIFVKKKKEKEKKEDQLESNAIHGLGHGKQLVFP